VPEGGGGAKVGWFGGEVDVEFDGGNGDLPVLYSYGECTGGAVPFRGCG